MKVYSLRYTAINIGASAGPLLGAYLAITNGKLAFIISGSIYFIYALVLLACMRSHSIISTEHSNVSLREAFIIVKRDKYFQHLILGFILGWFIAILGVVLFTLGEILTLPANSVLIDQLAEDHLRGTYFGAAQFRKLGNFAGPIIGGYLLNYIGGQNKLWIMSLICLGSILFFTIGSRIQIKSS